MNDVYLSIVIPAYNEEERIGTTLEKVGVFLRQQPYASEVIVVDDGSRDQTARVAEARLEGFSHEILRSPKNFGKGHAVKEGMLRARGKYVLFTDADLSTPLEEVRRLMDSLEQGYDIVIGSRALPESQIEVRQNPLREGMGKVFNFLARLFAFKDIHDSQCGFKGFRREAAHHLFSRQKINGFGFDAEILYLAQKVPYRMLEMPVTWRNSAKSRVSIFRDPFQMFGDLLRIRWIHRNA